VIPFLSPDDPFPPVDLALQVPNGLLAAGGDLTPERLLAAYREGVFPWFGDEDPILWWSPDPRMVLYTNEVHVSRSLNKVIKTNRFRVTLDQAFREVIKECAAARRDNEGTWITQAMEEAYVRLAELGHAHSVEAWEGDTLVGGLYGVALGPKIIAGKLVGTRFSISPNYIGPARWTLHGEINGHVDVTHKLRLDASLGALAPLGNGAYRGGARAQWDARLALVQRLGPVALHGAVTARGKAPDIYTGPGHGRTAVVLGISTAL